MKAVRYHSYGDSGVLVYKDADRPVAGPGQVVVKVDRARSSGSTWCRTWRAQMRRRPPPWRT
jgi:NADPH:quinone reductase-like Zn-dependent oxidoreductase